MHALEPAHADTYALYTRLLDAWNRRNADDFAAQFSLDGTTIGFDGSQMSGHAEIQRTLHGIFSQHPTATFVAKVRELRTLTPGVTLLRAIVGMKPRDKHELNQAVNAIQCIVAVGEPGTQRVTLLQNTPAALHGAPELVAQHTAELTAVLEAGQVVAPYAY